MKKRIVVQIPSSKVTQFMDAALMRRLEQAGEVLWNPHDRQYTEEELREVITDAQVCITSWGSRPLYGDNLQAAPKLELVAHMAGSVKPVVAEDTYARGVRVVAAGYAIAVSVAESSLAMLLSSLHHIAHVDRSMREGGWRQGVQVRELRNRRIGYVGFGTIARELHKLLRPFDMQVLAYDPYIDEQLAKEHGVQLATLDQVLAGSDILSVQLPDIPQTRHMINAKRLARLPDGALLLNTARGAVLDEQALIAELRTGRLWAALDVYEAEPLHPESELRELPNVLLRPHLAGVNPDSRRRIGEDIVSDIIRFCHGEPMRYGVQYQQLQRMT